MFHNAKMVSRLTEQNVCYQDLTGIPCNSFPVFPLRYLVVELFGHGKLKQGENYDETRIFVHGFDSVDRNPDFKFEVVRRFKDAKIFQWIRPHSVRHSERKDIRFH